MWIYLMIYDMDIYIYIVLVVVHWQVVRTYLMIEIANREYLADDADENLHQLCFYRAQNDRFQSWKAKVKGPDSALLVVQWTQREWKERLKPCPTVVIILGTRNIYENMPRISKPSVRLRPCTILASFYHQAIWYTTTFNLPGLPWKDRGSQCDGGRGLDLRCWDILTLPPGHGWILQFVSEEFKVAFHMHADGDI